MNPSILPEILRCDLTSSVLELKCVGQDLEDLDFLDNPGELSCTYRLGNVLRLLILINWSSDFFP